MKQKLAQWTRYAIPLIRYGALAKDWNLAAACFNYLIGAKRVSNMPAFLKVEISRHCKIQCKYCLGAKEEVFFPLERYKRLIDRFAPYVFVVSLYDIGEPLLNEEVLEYIRYAHDRRIGTAISSSLSLTKPADFWPALADSGLDRLIVAIDGVTPEVYRQYRTNGNLQLVLSNLKNVLRHRQAGNSRLTVEWQMVDLPWNRHEQESARRLAREMGCDCFRLIPEAALLRRQRLCQPADRDHSCLLPYILFLIDAYGRVRSCYKNYEIPMFVGNLNDSSFEEIWNGPEMISIRDKRQIRHRLGCGTCNE